MRTHEAAALPRPLLIFESILLCCSELMFTYLDRTEILEVSLLEKCLCKITPSCTVGPALYQIKSLRCLDLL
jgi:hypothetical protein